MSDKPPLRIGAYDVCFELFEYAQKIEMGYVVRRRNRPSRGKAYPTMALAIHHARRLNRLYPQRKVNP